MGLSAARVNKFLDRLRRESLDTVAQGSQFERLVRACLSVAPVYHQRYGKVWRWGEWARRHGISAQDTGIDLVAETRDGRYCAIQCKFFQPGHSLQKGEIASFLAAANESWGAEGKIVFSEMMLVSTATQLSSHAANSLRKQRIPGTYRGFGELAAALPEGAELEELLQTRSYNRLWERWQKQERKK